MRLTATPLLPNLLAGLTSGLVTLVYSISFAALIFSGKLAAFFPEGVAIALTGATVTSIIVAWRSAFPFALAGPEANSAIILSLAASSMAGAFEGPNGDSSLFPTVWAAIALSTVATGLFLHLLGRFRCGRLARYIPYPVIGGFLAGTGWLITRSSFKVMTGIPLSISTLTTLFESPHAAKWICGALFASLLFVFLNRAKHFLALPGVLLGGIALGNIASALPGHFSRPAIGVDWFFSSFSVDRVWRAWNWSTVGHIQWPVLFHYSGTLCAMMVIVMLSILLNSTGLELTTTQNVDLDHELKANGLANLVSGFCGGMVGYISINRCLLNQKAGARSPLAATIAGIFCGTVLLLGSSFLVYVPKPVLGGLLFYIGSNLLFRWIYKAWWQFPRAEYALIIVILTIIGVFGFIPGVVVGVLISCVLFILSYGRTSSIKYTLSGSHYRSNFFRPLTQQRLLEEEGDSVAIMVLHGFLFFGTANDLVETVRRRLAVNHLPKLVYAVFDFRLVTGLDCSATLSFLKLRQLAAKARLHLVFTQLSPLIEGQLRQGAVFASGQSEVGCFPDLDRGVEWCESQIVAGKQLPAGPSATLDAQLQDLLQSADSVSAIKAYMQIVDLEEGRALFRRGDVPDGLYFLESGQASVVVELENGRTLRRRTYTSGALLGEMGFYGQASRSAAVIADQPSRFHYLSAQAFARMELEQPHLAASFNRAVAKLVIERLRRSEDEVRSLLQ